MLVVQGFSPPYPRAAGDASPPASTTPPASSSTGRCRHHRTSCRACGTSPRLRAKAARLADVRTARACRMCVEVPDGGTWVRSVPGTQTAISPDQPCDHRTPTEVADQRPVGTGRAAALDFARTLPATRARTSRRDWRGRPTGTRTT